MTWLNGYECWLMISWGIILPNRLETIVVLNMKDGESLFTLLMYIIHIPFPFISN